MTKRLGVVVVLAVLALSWRPVPAEAPADSEARLSKDLKYLTSHECEGRGITTKGINLAADYIKVGFQQAGLKPGAADGTYFQTFSLTTGAKLGKNNRLVLRGPQGQAITLERDSHYIVSLISSTGKTDAPVVFAGFGLRSTDPAYDDFAGLDVAGKAVVILSGAPRAGNPHANVFAAVDSGYRAKIENARKRKAVAVLVVNDDSTANRTRDLLPRSRRVSPRSGDPYGLPVIQVRRDWVDRMLASGGGADLATLEKEIDADLKPRSRALTGWTCQLETDVTHTRTQVKNVIGVLEGAGPLASETIVLGAHYDHIGYGSGAPLGGRGVSPPGAPGGAGFPLAEMGRSAIHHGADDNASGTSAVMELARRFGAQKNRQGRRLVFMTFTAEESGLIGSAYYCSHPVLPLKDTVAMINLDMVGRLQEGKLMLGGLASAKEFPKLIDRHNQRHRLTLARENAGTGPSDHSSFFTKGVPVLFLFTGFHEQYHRPSDRFETLNIDGVRRITDFVSDITTELAAAPKRPEYVRTRASFDRGKVLWSGAPSVGIVAVPGPKGEGVVVESVVSNTPAARAGVKKGDRLVALAGKPFKGLTEYLDRARTLKMGEKVELTLHRDGKPQTVQLQLSRGSRRVTMQWLGTEVEVGGDLRQGAALAGVKDNSPAAKAGLKQGDRLVAVAGTRISDFRSLSSALASRPKSKVQVTVLRGGKEQTLEITPE